MAQNTGLFRDRSDYMESLLQLFELIKANNEEVEAKRTVYKLIFSLHLIRFVCLFFVGVKNCLFFCKYIFVVLGIHMLQRTILRSKMLYPTSPPFTPPYIETTAS